MFHMFSRSQNCEKHLLASSCLVCPPVPPSDRPMEKLRSHEMDFMKFDTWEIFENPSRTFKRHYNLRRINGTLHEDQHTFLIIYSSVLLRMRNFSDKRSRKNQNTRFVPNNYFRKSCSLWDNPYPTAFLYGNGMVLHFYQQQESSTTKTVHKVINKGLKAYV